jgi:hypothetical protein
MRKMVVLVVMAGLVAACSGTTEPPATASSSSTTVTPTTVNSTTSTSTTTTQPVAAPAPWSNPPIADPPQVLVDQWEAADNKDWCSALYPIGPADSAATVRKANFGGGWGVAWDLPDGPGREATGAYCADCGRGAYGIAGTGVRAQGDEPLRWPNQLSWDDGSIAGYGYEGDADPTSGAPLLMYLLVNGEGCTYNIWSFLGKDHLLQFVDGLRKVEGLDGEPTAWLSQQPSANITQLGAPPWDATPLPVSDVPRVEITEWEGELGAPTGCPMLAFADLGEAEGATPRRATNEGEMLVAWDLPSGPGHDASGNPCENCGRGVIGLGTFPADTGEGLPVVFEWDDGSIARIRSSAAITYGTEAFLSVQGFDCTYWVWSHLGENSLEYLLSQLRRVEGIP